MANASISQVKNGLSAYIDKVKAGESVVITDRGIPVAVLEPVTRRADWDEGVARLVREGVVRRPRGTPSIDILAEPPISLSTPVDVVAMLIEERRDGR